MSPTSTDVLLAIREIAAQELDMALEILPSHELIGDLELDSISLVTLLASLENRFRVRLPTTYSEEVCTVDDIVQLVVQRTEERKS